VLEFVAIKRNDGGGWAIPGGMVDPGEAVTVTCKREFGEEALNSEGVSAEERHHIEKQVHELFNHGEEVYKGYVDDPRNTDNAWMETVALNFHDEKGDVFSKFKLHAGDDAGAVRWMTVDGKAQLYASHIDFLRAVATKRNAYF
jgi:8-oxo-dGTP pyrophosphatase MutT (NUDIX family)